MRLPQLVGISVFFRMMIADPRAFSRSARRLLEWDFQQIVVAHAEPIREKARGILEKALRDQDLLDNRYNRLRRHEIGPRSRRFLS